MTNCTKLIGSSAAMILTACAAADFNYEQVLLTAESGCFTGSDRAVVQQSIGVDSSLEATSSCGGGMSTAYIEAHEYYFVLAAGSTVPGMNSSEEEEVPVILDGGNGHSSVEIQFTIDRPTMFTMSRSMAGSEVRFWDENDLLDSLDEYGDRTALPAGTYWATTETDAYGTPVWSEVSVWQQAKDPADLNDDGKIDQKDIPSLVSLIKKASNEKPAEHPTGGECTDASNAKQQDKPSLQTSKGSPINGRPLPRPKPGSFGSEKDDKGGPIAIDFDEPTNYSHHEFELSDNSGPIMIDDKGRRADKDDKPIAIELDKVEIKGDLNGDKEVDYKDLFFLLERL